MNVDNSTPVLMDAINASSRARPSSSPSFAQTLAEHQAVPSEYSQSLALRLDDEKSERGRFRHPQTKPLVEDDVQVSHPEKSPSDELRAKPKDDAPDDPAPHDCLPMQAWHQAESLTLTPNASIANPLVDGQDDAVVLADVQLGQREVAAMQADKIIHADQLFDIKQTQQEMLLSPSTQLMTASRAWLSAEKKAANQAPEPWAGLMAADSTTQTLTPHAVVPAAPVPVAEQLKHWLVRDVQHAQLLLQGFGQEPVEVTIRLQGQMAHVVFGTDNAQARQLLEGSLRELSSLLLQDGLMLSGASVGTSSQGQASSRFGPSSYSQSRGVLPKPEIDLIASDSQTPRLTTHGLDLYV